MKSVSVFLLSLCLLMAAVAQVNAQDLALEFQNPPQSAYPKTWMHCMSGNMSKEGLTKDFEAMAKVGIGGVLMFNITQGIPLGEVIYNSPEHQAMITHAAAECQRLGLSFGVHNCDGWSSSGGPWIRPEDSMKMAVHGQAITEGGSIAIQLPQPPMREGFYKDIAVLAYPALASEIEDSLSVPIITASGGKFEPAAAIDNDIDTVFGIKKDKDGKVWLQYDYNKSVTIRSVTVLTPQRDPVCKLMVSEDGRVFQSAHSLTSVRTGKGEWAFNDSFEPVKGRFFRLQFNADISVKEAVLSSVFLIDNRFGKTCLSRTSDSAIKSVGNPEASMIVDSKTIIDLTAKMDSAGRLKADLPKGRWTILRFGFTSTGASNHPASKEGRGLECDKLNRDAFKRHYDAFVAKVALNKKTVAPDAMQYIEIDSYEMGGQNWTDELAEVFKKQKGYDLLPFMLLYAGRFVDSAETSEAVLWDIRNVVCDLMTENYYAYFAELCHQDGLKTYIEPYGNGPVNNLDVGRYADIPMGEFWMNRSSQNVDSAVYSARIYGKSVVSAESFTSQPEVNWKGHPAMAKITGDRAWINGINEFMFHRFAHQANTHVMPGMTMNRWGFHFDRTQTWWENAGAEWFKYIARGSYLLRQGVPVCDALIFIGDGSPNSTAGGDGFKPAFPDGTAYDCVNADVLLHRINCKDGLMTLPEGNTYKLLALSNCEKLTLPTLRRLKQLSEQGVVIAGKKPSKMAGYSGTPQQAAEFASLADFVWSQKTTFDNFDWPAIFKQAGVRPDFMIDGKPSSDCIHRRVGDTDIYFFYNGQDTPRTFDCQFQAAGRIPELWNPMDGTTVQMGQFAYQDGYTRVSVHLTPEQSAFVVFRKSAKDTMAVKPLLSGLQAGAAFYLNAKNAPMMSVSKNGSYDIELNSDRKVSVKVADIPDAFKLEGAWSVSFNAPYGYKNQVEFDRLMDWKEHALDDIKYFSGTATYRKSFELPEAFMAKGNRMILNLGRVEIAAKVKVNGHDVGILWMYPYQADITKAVRAGSNTLEIEITNLWVNRLIGDEKLPAHDNYKLGSSVPTTKMPAWYVNNEPMPAGPRSTFCTGQFFKAGDSLVSSGLLGPVEVSVVRDIELFD